jgi:hypothetical protein
MSSLKKYILNDLQDSFKILVLRVCMLRSKVEDKISKVKIEDEILKGLSRRQGNKFKSRRPIY